MPAEKSAEPVAAGTPLAELSDCALMGTVVRAGSGTGAVVATGDPAEFGRIALGLGKRQPEPPGRSDATFVHPAGAVLLDLAGLCLAGWRLGAKRRVWVAKRAARRRTRKPAVRRGPGRGFHVPHA
jgi:hypothetical protein